MKTLALRQIGNSQGIILEKTILDLIGADQKNTVFAVEIAGDTIKLKPLSQAEQNKIIEDAADEITNEQAPILEKLAK